MLTTPRLSPNQRVHLERQRSELIRRLRDTEGEAREAVLTRLRQIGLSLGLEKAMR